MDTDLIERARCGDQDAFGELMAPHRRELHVHCYRMLGSVADADDALQETMLAAWRHLAGFEGRASLRTWLYRIATNRALNMLRTAHRHSPAQLQADVGPPEPTRLGEVTWLQPYPDVLFDEWADTNAGPERRYESHEAISLAFVTALQLLPPRQRAVLVLQDVLGFPAKAVATMLATTEQSVSSALKRARSTLAADVPAADRAAPQPGSPSEEDLLRRLVDAFERADVDGMVALMTEDAWLRMPPVPLEYQGRELIARFFETVAFRNGRQYRLVPARANGQPAFGVYLTDQVTGVAHAFGLLVITLAGDAITTITRFDNTALSYLGLPRTLGA